MDHEADVIKQQMEQTRSSLAEKLETLEEHVTSKVRTTADAVTGTVEAVKGAVEDTVQSVSESVENVKETVKETFDLHHQMEEHPWLMLGGGVAVGYFGSRLLESGVGAAAEAVSAAASVAAAPRRSQGNGNPRRAAERPERSTWDKLAEAFAPSIEKLQGLALGAATSLVGNMVLESVPEAMRSDVEQVIEELTRNLGGKPMPGFLHSNPAQERATAPPPRT